MDIHTCIRSSVACLHFISECFMGFMFHKMKSFSWFYFQMKKLNQNNNSSSSSSSKKLLVVLTFISPTRLLSPAYWFIKLYFGVCTLGSIPLQCEPFPSNQTSAQTNMHTKQRTYWNFARQSDGKNRAQKRTTQKLSTRGFSLLQIFHVCNLQPADLCDKKLNCSG